MSRPLRRKDKDTLADFLEEWARRDQERAEAKLHAYFDGAHFTLWGKSYNIHDKAQKEELVSDLMRLLTDAEVIQAPWGDDG